MASQKMLIHFKLFGFRLQILYRAGGSTAVLLATDHYNFVNTRERARVCGSADPPFSVFDVSNSK